jgi:hypothetical protein
MSLHSLLGPKHSNPAPPAAPAAAARPDVNDFLTWTPDNWAGLDFEQIHFPTDPNISICSVRAYHAVNIKVQRRTCTAASLASDEQQIAEDSSSHKLQDTWQLTQLVKALGLVSKGPGISFISNRQRLGKEARNVRWRKVGKSSNNL